MHNFRNKLMYIGITSLCILFLFLAIYPFDANTLWHDEAEVALLGKQILKTGVSSGLSVGNVIDELI